MASGYKIKRGRGGKLRHPAALRSKSLGKPRLNSRSGLKAFRTGKS